MFWSKSVVIKNDGMLRRLNEKIHELEEFIQIEGQYRSDFEIKRAKIMMQELKYIKTGERNNGNNL